MAMEWSPMETYVITCEKVRSDIAKEAVAPGNLNIWSATTGEIVKSFDWRNTPKEGPKSIGFDSEEKFCAR